MFGVAGEVERVAGVFSDPGISALGLIGEEGGDARAPTQGNTRSQNFFTEMLDRYVYDGSAIYMYIGEKT